MIVRRALVRAAITNTVLIGLSAVATHAVASRLPEGGGLKLLRGATVEDPTVGPPICLMSDCVEAEDAPRFCFMQHKRLHESANDCSRPPSRIRLLQLPSPWPTRSGAPI